MLFSQLFSASLIFLTFGLAAATPTPKEAKLIKRTGTSSDIQEVFTTLKQTTDSVLPKIDSLASGGTATEAAVAPLIGELTSALNKATSSLASIDGPVSTDGGPSEQDIANLVAGIIKDVATTLNGLTGATAVPTLTLLLPGIDLALNQVLLGLDILLSGVLDLVANLLTSVAGLLRSLNLGLLLGTLGL
ncbi:hypothetical protein BDZ94DRAFT_1290091 [Collybia nuda]|uniref:Uncharacterized protein n=1 Tax=Collybia nuda TaxID=64659 RepID=A0A9P5Y5Y5_9AGAR|nr:hypothetical protein BDZ94DRAFT_1290091 [Collybia nuda]